MKRLPTWPIRPWDRLLEDPGDPWDVFAAWKRWMDAKDEAMPEGFEPFLDDLGGLELADLYGRFRAVADGDELPYLARLCSVLSEPWVKLWWAWCRWRHDVYWDTRWYLGHWRAGRRPRHDGRGYYTVAWTDADGRPHGSGRGMWWDRLPLRRQAIMRRHRRWAAEQAKVATTEDA